MLRADFRSRFTSIATLSLIASTYLEKEVGFWAAYLLPLCSVWIVVPLLFVWYKPLGSDKSVSFIHRDADYLKSEASATRQRSTTRIQGHHVLDPRWILLRRSKTRIPSRKVRKAN